MAGWIFIFLISIRMAHWCTTIWSGNNLLAEHSCSARINENPFRHVVRKSICLQPINLCFTPTPHRTPHTTHHTHKNNMLMREKSAKLTRFLLIKKKYMERKILTHSCFSKLIQLLYCEGCYTRYAPVRWLLHCKAIFALWIWWRWEWRGGWYVGVEEKKNCCPAIILIKDKPAKLAWKAFFVFINFVCSQCIASWFSLLIQTE